MAHRYTVCEAGSSIDAGPFEDAISAQYATQIPGLAKPTFERLRALAIRRSTSTRSNAEISADDSAWALSTALAVVEAVGRLLAADPPDLFE